ncbi:MAG: DUF58 domain-containing protein [Myxococcota bacterium]
MQDGSLLRLGAAWAPEASDLARAARTLQLRSRREVAGALAGGYRSAFRGGGIEFEESRPYVPGDDVRAIDWNALARTGQTYVKHHREERDQSLLLLVDGSASMAFGSQGPSKLAVAVRSAALLAAAAAQAGDRVALFTFDRAVRDEIRPGRGPAHGLRLLRALVETGANARGRTALAPVLRHVAERVRRRGIVFVLSDLRDEALLAEGGDGGLRAALGSVARRHDLVFGWITDPAERALARLPALWIADPEAGGAPRLLRGRSRAARERYAVTAELRARRLERRLRGDGADWLALPTDADPLRILGRFFAERALRRRGVRP